MQVLPGGVQHRAGEQAGQGLVANGIRLLPGRKALVDVLENESAQHPGLTAALMLGLPDDLVQNGTGPGEVATLVFAVGLRQGILLRMQRRHAGDKREAQGQDMVPGAHSCAL